MSKHLMLFTIGPVQSFIAQARKTQDLWAGSYLLSHLIDRTKKKMTEIGISKNDIIFPDVDATLQDEIASLPNRLLFLTLKPKNVANELVNVIDKEFENICKFAFEKLKVKFPNKIFANFIPRQTKNYIETFWVAIPFKEGSDYARKYADVVALLRSRKQVVNFGSLAEQGIKCPVCGEREAIRLEEKQSKKDVLALWRNISRVIQKINPNETLCTVCLGKRFFPDYMRKNSDIGLVSFPSTAEVASSKFNEILIERNKYDELENIFPYWFRNSSQKGKLLPKIKKICRLDPIEGHWLFEDNYSEREFKTNFDTASSMSDFIKVGAKLKNFIKENKIQKISKYYAVFFMDGDGIGDKINRVHNLLEHRQLTKAMAEFASNDVKEVVEMQNLGKLVYSGGDDVAALVNLNDLLTVLDSLRKAFKARMGEKIKFISEPFTMSAGVAIAHFKSPFGLVLEYARSMEEKAKKFDNGKGKRKNAVGISVITRAGNIKESVITWEIDKENSTVSVMKKLINMLLEGTISKNFIFVLKQEFQSFFHKNGQSEVEVDIFHAELIRTLKRAVNREQDKYIAEELGEKLFGFHKNIFNGNLENFIAFLEICNALGQEMQNEVKDKTP